MIEISLLTDVSSWRLYGSVRKVENGAITSFKVSLKERRVRNFETRVTDIGSIQSFSVDTRSSYVVLYKSCCVNAEEERKKERKKKWRRGEGKYTFHWDTRKEERIKIRIKEKIDRGINLVRIAIGWRRWPMTPLIVCLRHTTSRQVKLTQVYIRS